MFRTKESRILDLERRAGSQTDKRFLVIIDNNRDEAELESFGHVLSDNERQTLERINIEITGTHDVDPGVVKRLEEIAAKNASEPPWQPDLGPRPDMDKSDIVPPGEPEGTQTKPQTFDRELSPEIDAQREESIIRMLEGY